MLTVGSTVRKLFKAFVALEGFLASVESCVFHEVMFVLESFVTTITLMRSLV